jgi:hypothetical protein
VTRAQRSAMVSAWWRKFRERPDATEWLRERDRKRVDRARQSGKTFVGVSGHRHSVVVRQKMGKAHKRWWIQNPDTGYWSRIRSAAKRLRMDEDLAFWWLAMRQAYREAEAPRLAAERAWRTRRAGKAIPVRGPASFVSREDKLELLRICARAFGR